MNELRNFIVGIAVLGILCLSGFVSLNKKDKDIANFYLFVVALLLFLYMIVNIFTFMN